MSKQILLVLVLAMGAASAAAQAPSPGRRAGSYEFYISPIFTESKSYSFEGGTTARTDTGYGFGFGFAALLTLAAILGKLACAVAVPRGVSGLTVGLGMMPRGEVGLIFAGIGAQLVLDGRPIVDAGTYAAAVFMVVATTLVTPPLLSWALRRTPERPPSVALKGGA